MINLIKKSINTFNKEVDKINQETKIDTMKQIELNILDKMLLKTQNLFINN